MGKNDFRYYVVVPARIASGGPELAHQLCSELNNWDIEAKMYYIADGNLDPVNTQALPRYQKYNTSCAEQYAEANSPNSVVVINESSTSYIPFFEKAEIALWWMSVDNYLIDPYKLSGEDIKRYVKYHLVQSRYAYTYLRDQVKIPENKIIELSDYTSVGFQKRLFPDDARQNWVLYNPKKGLNNLQPLIQMTPEVTWVPLINFEEEKLQKIMQLSKVYVDFGNHPGKDRLPRETAISGCCIITNKQGSAGFYEDIPIPEEYKFDKVDECYSEIKKLILDICDHFQEHTLRFEDYREWIMDEKNRFTSDTMKMITIISGQ